MINQYFDYSWRHVPWKSIDPMLNQGFLGCIWLYFFFGEWDQSTWVTLLQFDKAMEEDPFSSMA